MFPEYQELIQRLRQEDETFLKMYNEHSDLNTKIERMSKHNATVINDFDELDSLKKHKLHLKEKIYTYLKNYA